MRVTSMDLNAFIFISMGRTLIRFLMPKSRCESICSVYEGVCVCCVYLLCAHEKTVFSTHTHTHCSSTNDDGGKDGGKKNSSGTEKKINVFAHRRFVILACTEGVVIHNPF